LPSVGGASLSGDELALSSIVAEERLHLVCEGGEANKDEKDPLFSLLTIHFESTKSQLRATKEAIGWTQAN